MNELGIRATTGIALCAGVGGMELGLRLAIPGYRTIAYVEREAYAAGRLAARIADGALDEGPIWDDLATFDGLPWRGRVDIISSGFPCQPFSQARQGRGTADPRWLWPHIIRIIRDIRPSYIFLENSPRIRKEALAIMLADLSRAGFDAEWDVFSAAEEGYPHLRKRFFLLAAHPTRVRWEKIEWHESERALQSDGGGQASADPLGLRGLRAEAERSSEEAGGRPRNAATINASHPHSAGCKALRRGGLPASGRDATAGRSGRPDAAHPDEFDGDPSRHGAGTLCGLGRGEALLSGGETPKCAFWCAQSGVCVLDDGSAYRLDQLRALGNAVVPEVAARAWRELVGRIGIT